MTLFKYLVTLLLAASFFGSACSATPIATAPFQDGDRWTAIGDSITHGGKYYMWVYLYYATRFPEMQLDVANAGNSGDDAHGALERYDWDIMANDPTVVTVMLGMNDVRREIYGDMPETPQLLDQRMYILEGYRSFMTKLVNHLQADDIRLILITPSIYDETAQQPREILTGVNGALGECAEFVTELSNTNGATLVDFYGPMNTINAQIQEVDPAASLIKADRVHPNPMGQFVMGYLFLKSIDAPGIVSSVTIDAKTSKLVAIENASIEDLSINQQTIRFTLLEEALPYPIGKDEQAALEWIPFQSELNREMFQVTGLAEGDYTLFIDEKAIRPFESVELAAGVNLALETNTPQAMQSAQVLELMEAWFQQIQDLRFIRSFEFWSLYDVPHPLTYDTAQEQVGAILASLQDPDSKSEQSMRKRCERYLESKLREMEIQDKIAEIAAEIRTAAIPKPHEYRLEPIQ